MSDSSPVSALYRSLVDAGTVKDDPGQKEVIKALDNLYKEINFSSHINYIKHIFSENKIMGVYIYGRVGRGKSYLMDIFYKLVQNKRCMRVHQYNFMQYIYEYMKEASSLNNKNPLKFAINKLTKNISLLCIDEFEVLDVADAMILERIYSIFYKKNIKVVLTSNTNPIHLYKDGLQRERFLPFIELVKNFMITEKVLDGKDYRIKLKDKSGTHEFQDFYFLPSNLEFSENLFNILRNNLPINSITLEFNARRLIIDKISNNVGFFSFQNLCESNFSSVDYIQLSKKCDWVIISDVPKLSVEDRNLAKRFQMLIDILYDSKIGLTVSSDIKPEDIYIEGDGHKEFRRTISRIYEMTHKEWMNKIKNKDFKKLLNI